MRQVNEEGFALVLFDEIDRLLRVSSRNGALIHGKLDDFFVLKQRRLPLGQSRLWVLPEDVHAIGTSFRFSFVVRVIHVIGIGNPVIGVETVRSREHFRMMPKVPLAKAGRSISLRLQMISDGVFFRIETFGRCGKKDVLVHADAFGITAR